MAVLVVNIIMILLRLTRSVNLDLWNWWIFLAAGSVVYFVTEKEWLAVLSACVISIITLVLSDIYAPKFESYYEIKGITNTQAQLIAWAPLTQLVNTVFNRIPGIKKIRIVFFRLYYRLGFFSEPLIIGFILGFIFGAVIKYRTIHINTGRDILFAAAYGLYLAAIVIVIPKMSALIFKGLSPAIKDLVKFIESRITKRSIHISLDSILFSGHPSVISISVVFIPLTAYIATILPGNKILPSADLILIPLLLVWILAQSKGDLIRTFISASLIIPLTLWISTDMADLFTGFFSKHSIEMAQDIKHFSSYGAGSNWFFWVILQIIRPLLNIFS
jgi:PTS system galactitol-specific IIC component